MVIGGDCVCTLWFLRPVLLGVCCKSSVLSRAFVLRSPLELIIMPLLGWQLLSSLTSSHIWCPVPPWFRVVLGHPLLPHSMGREQGWGHLRANPWFRVFWFIPPSCPSLSLDNLLYRVPWSTHWVGMTWVQVGFTGLSPDV